MAGGSANDAVGREGSKKPCELFRLWLRESGVGFSGEFFRDGPSLMTWDIEGREALCRELELELELDVVSIEGRCWYGGRCWLVDTAVSCEELDESLPEEWER